MEITGEILRRAKENPTFDAVEHAAPAQPKLEIAKLVTAMTGIPSPYVDNDEFTELIPQGTARIRSELAQDYSGLSGLYESPIVRTDHPEPNDGYAELLAELQHGRITPEEFMQHHPYHSLNWANEQKKITELSRRFGITELARIPEPTASLWKQVDGTHAVIMADSYVEGLYHLGVRKPGEPLDGYDYNVQTGKTIMHAGKHSEPIDARPFVEAYDTVRPLEVFDVTQRPIMELMMGFDGVVQFLQVKKTGHTENYHNDFELERPNPAKGFISNQVMGVTLPEGREVDLAISPMPHEMGDNTSVFTDMMFDIMDDPLAAQIVWRNADVAVVEQGLGFRDSHSSSTPMHGPNLTVATFGIPIENGEFERWRGYFEELKYAPTDEPLTVKIISNGREASVEGNWPPIQM